MRTVGGHAVVMGASMAGLVAARVLADAYERVTVLDRDELTKGATVRKGVPQGSHVHVLLPGGREVLEDLFPGYTADLIAAGAPTGDALGQFRWHVGGHRFCQVPLGITSLLATRPLIEEHVRARTAALPNVEMVGRCDILGLCVRGGVVDGVRVLRRADGSAEEVLPADLVIDCTGRGSRTPVRLQELGFSPPPEERTRLGLGYASRVFRLRPGALGDDLAVLISAAGGGLRGGAGFAVEGDRWLVTLAGFLGDHPPTDGDGFAAFAKSLDAPDIYDAIRSGEALSGAVAYTYPASLRRRYEALRSFPAGLLVMGDAVASFNPVYGQGMTVAALQARALRRLLQLGTPPSPRRFFAAISTVVSLAWDLALGADLSLPQVEGARTRRIRLLNRYVARTQAAAAIDPVVGAAFLRVTGLIDPPQRLMAPGMAWRVLRAGRTRRPTVAGTAAGASAPARSSEAS